MKIEM